jgi:hypothetical protein
MTELSSYNTTNSSRHPLANKRSGIESKFYETFSRPKSPVKYQPESGSFLPLHERMTESSLFNGILKKFLRLDPLTSVM